MKNNIIFFKRILLTILLIIWSQQIIFSQGNYGNNEYQKGLYVGVSSGFSLTQIKNEGLFSGSELRFVKKITIPISAEIGYYFSKMFGFSLGVTYSSYKTQFSLASYEDKFETTDSENEKYELRVSGSNIKEDQNIRFLSVPICINFRSPLAGPVGLFVQTGINLSYPLSKTYSSSGTFTYKGYYATYNVLLENLPDYGFPSNQSTVANGELSIKPAIISFIGSAGLEYSDQKSFRVTLAAVYNRSFSNCSAYNTNDKFHLSTGVNKVNSLMEGSSNVILESIGVKIGIRYYF